MLDFYAARSPIFLAAVLRRRAAAERGQQIGDGTPVHITIPTDNPWVPLRILGLGKGEGETVSADVYLLTDQRPALLPIPALAGLASTTTQRATDALLDDLRADKGMEWVPAAAWLTKIGIDVDATRSATTSRSMPPVSASPRSWTRASSSRTCPASAAMRRSVT